jgi:hypothetical protein
MQCLNDPTRLRKPRRKAPENAAAAARKRQCGNMLESSQRFVQVWDETGSISFCSMRRSGTSQRIATAT